jgi:hypothetical protein
MWFPFWLWLVPLVLLLSARCGRRRWHRERRGEDSYAGGTQRTVDAQREYIEQLEARLSRVEEGLEFAERLLAERGATAP